MTERGLEVLRFVNVTARVTSVCTRRLIRTLESVGGNVALLPFVDSHYRDWLKAAQRRERVGLRRLQPWRYEPPVATPIGTLLARVKN
jgi:hypothetical protein